MEFFLLICTLMFGGFGAVFLAVSIIAMPDSFLTSLITFVIGVALLGASYGAYTKGVNIANDELSKDLAYVEYDGSYYEKTPILSADEESDVFVLERNGDKYIITKTAESGIHKVSVWINYVYISTEENLTEPYMFEANGKTYVVVPTNYVERVVA